MNIEKLKQKYGLEEWSTGGNCTALGINIGDNQILITDGECRAPIDGDAEFLIGVYLEDMGEPEHTFTTNDIKKLDGLISEAVKLCNMTQQEFYNLPEVQEQLIIQKMNRYGSEEHKTAYFKIGEIAKEKGVSDMYKSAGGGEY